MSAARVPSSRPLDLGELLDAATSLAIRHLVPLALVYLGFALLDDALEFATGIDVGHGALHDLASLGALRHGRLDPRAIAHGLGRSPARPSAGHVLVVVALALVGPLPTGALAIATERFARGDVVSVGVAYRTALARWLPLIAIECLYGVAFAGLSFVGLFATAAAVALAAAAGPASLVLLVAIGVVFAAGALAWAAAASLTLLAANLAFCASALDRVPVRDAVACGVRLVAASRRADAIRTLATGAAIAAIAFAAGALEAAVAGLVVATTRSAILGALVELPVDVGSAILTWVFVTLAYRDLRARVDGADLVVAARRLREPA